MMMSAARTQLLIVDMQERLMPTMVEGERALANAIRLVKAAEILAIPALSSEQYPQGLGPTVAPLKEAMGPSPRFEKLSFSAAADPRIARHIRDEATWGRDQIVLAGVETHICVLQSALGFRKMGLSVFVVADAAAAHSAESAALAFHRLRNAGIAVVDSDMALFEWLGAAGTPRFKAMRFLLT
jgi:nicotinamidase-related amidase